MNSIMETAMMSRRRSASEVNTAMATATTIVDDATREALDTLRLEQRLRPTPAQCRAAEEAILRDAYNLSTIRNLIEREGIDVNSSINTMTGKTMLHTAMTFVAPSRAANANVNNIAAPQPPPLPQLPPLVGGAPTTTTVPRGGQASGTAIITNNDVTFEMARNFRDPQLNLVRYLVEVKGADVLLTAASVNPAADGGGRTKSNTKKQNKKRNGSPSSATLAAFPSSDGHSPFDACCFDGTGPLTDYLITHRGFHLKQQQKEKEEKEEENESRDSAEEEGDGAHTHVATTTPDGDTNDNSKDRRPEQQSANNYGPITPAIPSAFSSALTADVSTINNHSDPSLPILYTNGICVNATSGPLYFLPSFIACHEDTVTVLRALISHGAAVEEGDARRVRYCSSEKEEPYEEESDDDEDGDEDDDGVDEEDVNNLSFRARIVRFFSSSTSVSGKSKANRRSSSSPSSPSRDNERSSTSQRILKQTIARNIGLTSSSSPLSPASAAQCPSPKIPSYTRSPLFGAAVNGSIECVRMLLDNGCDVNPIVFDALMKHLPSKPMLSSGEDVPSESSTARGGEGEGDVVPLSREEKLLAVRRLLIENCGFV